MKTTINLNIERIVLHGLHQVDRHALAEALRQALVEQLAVNPSLNTATLTTTDLSRVRASIRLPEVVDAEQLGQRLGQSLSTIISNNEAVLSSGTKATPGGRHHA